MIEIASRPAYRWGTVKKQEVYITVIKCSCLAVFHRYLT